MRAVEGEPVPMTWGCVPRRRMVPGHGGVVPMRREGERPVRVREGYRSGLWGYHLRRGAGGVMLGDFRSEI